MPNLLYKTGELKKVRMTAHLNPPDEQKKQGLMKLPVLHKYLWGLLLRVAARGGTGKTVYRGRGALWVATVLRLI